MNKDAMYHACRLAFICGESVSWNFVVHAIRQGLNLRSKTHTLTAKDFEKYPQLEGLVRELKRARGAKLTKPEIERAKKIKKAHDELCERAIMESKQKVPATRNEILSAILRMYNQLKGSHANRIREIAKLCNLSVRTIQRYWNTQ